MALPRLALCIFFLAFSFFQQAPPSPTPKQTPSPQKSDNAGKNEYADEAFVLESLHTKMRFENDGSNKREIEARVRIQSDAGVRDFGQLVIGYNSANEELNIDAVDVRKPDGTVISVSAGAVQDMTAPVAQDAPVYTDYRQKHITVPALRPGDTLTYRVSFVTQTPMAAGQFWTEYDFVKNAISLDEQLEINVPRERAIKLKTLPGFEPSSSDEGARRIYRWKHSELKRETPEEAAKDKSKKPEWPDVQLTTFKSWAEVGQWYAPLERERAVPTSSVRSKAEELVRGKKTDVEKIQALYDFVARDFRYVSLSFGVGRFQPHSASDVLTNEYGDCKDKHTLLEALIEAVGLHADPVLASSRRKVDPDVPSPGQFDHMFTVVRTGADEKSWMWMDTTTEVAPFRLLAAPLRKKQVLVIPMNGGPAHLVETPADPPFPASQRVDVEGSLSELGKLTAKITYTVRGDTELLLRVAFRRTPRTQWKDLAREIAMADGIRGDVTDIHAGDPAATEEPFRVEIDVAQANFFDWSSRSSHLTLPLPSAGLPEAPGASGDADAANEPIEIGSPLETVTHAELALPAGFKAEAPVPVSVTRDYAEYASAYKVEGNKISAERTLRFRMRELPAARERDYLAFAHAVRSDEAQGITLETTSAAKPTVPEGATANELFEAAQAALQAGRFPMAIELLDRVVKLEPQHKSAWNALGLAHFNLGNFGRAAECFQKQIDINPYDEHAYLWLGLALFQQQKYSEAEGAFEKQIEINPLDKQAHPALAQAFLQEHKYQEAVPELEKSATLSPGDPTVRVSLGNAYLNSDRTDEALAAFDKAVELSPTPEVWNNIAYNLAQKNVRLDRAQQYAESAVSSVAADLRNVSLGGLSQADLGHVSSISAYWDTLGWVLFRKGDLASAERYVRASWLLDQHGEVGDHLGQIYAKRGEKQRAIDQYALALAADLPPIDMRGRLAVLVGGDDKVGPLVEQAKAKLTGMRMISLGAQKWPSGDKETLSATFFVLLEPVGEGAAKVADVKFASGDDALQSLAGAVKAAHFADQFPDSSPVKIVRQGTLTCTKASGTCAVELVRPDRARTSN